MLGFFVRIIESFSNIKKIKIEKGDWELVLRVGVVIVIEPIDLFPLFLCFFTFHSIIKFMHKNNLE
jgi:hypothetical protein